MQDYATCFYGLVFQYLWDGVEDPDDISDLVVKALRKRLKRQDAIAMLHTPIENIGFETLYNGMWRFYRDYILSVLP
jgi:hypothetical protein